MPELVAAPGAALLLAQAEAVKVFGIRLVGLTPDTAKKIALTAALVAVLIAVRFLVRRVVRPARAAAPGTRARSWTEQVLSLAGAAVLVVGLLSIWFESPERLTSVLGFVAAGAT